MVIWVPKGAISPYSGSRVKKLKFVRFNQRLTQNVWETVLEVYGQGDVVGVFVWQDDVGETIELKITMDDEVFDDDNACAADTPYYVYKNGEAGTPALGWEGFTQYNFGYYVSNSFKTYLKVEVRKTTAAGNKPTRVNVLYQTRD